MRFLHGIRPEVNIAGGSGDTGGGGPDPQGAPAPAPAAVPQQAPITAEAIAAALERVVQPVQQGLTQLQTRLPAPAQPEWDPYERTQVEQVFQSMMEERLQRQQQEFDQRLQQLTQQYGATWEESARQHVDGIVEDQLGMHRESVGQFNDDVAKWAAMALLARQDLDPNDAFGMAARDAKRITDAIKAEGVKEYMESLKGANTGQQLVPQGAPAPQPQPVAQDGQPPNAILRNERDLYRRSALATLAQAGMVGGVAVPTG